MNTVSVAAADPLYKRPQAQMPCQDARVRQDCTLTLRDWRHCHAHVSAESTANQSSSTPWQVPSPMNTNDHMAMSVAFGKPLPGAGSEASGGVDSLGDTLPGVASLPP